MTKLKIGDEFSDDGDPIEPSEVEEATIDDDGTPSDVQNQTGNEPEEVEEEESDDVEVSTKDPDEELPDDDAKVRELQGLRKTEEELGNDLSDLDIQIQSARERIVSKRQARRTRRDLIQTIGTKTDDAEEQDDLSDIDEEQIQLFERIAKSRGYIPKTEFEAQRFETARKSAQKEFVKEHPEYHVNNDTEDILFTALQKELSKYVVPEDPDEISERFEDAHEKVMKKYPERFSKKKVVTKQQVAAQSRMKVASAGSKTPSAPQSKVAKKMSAEAAEVLTDERIQILKNSGWSDKDIEELQD